jgi:hypothetical protein
MTSGSGRINNPKILTITHPLSPKSAVRVFQVEVASYFDLKKSRRGKACGGA